MTDVEELASSVRSRLFQSIASREQLEQILLMLPTALSAESPRRAVELFAEAACSITGARVALIEVPEVLNEPFACGLDGELVNLPVDLAWIPALAPAFSGRTVHIPDAINQIGEVERAALGMTSDGRELRSLLALPVRGRTTHAHGVICLAHHRARAFSERQVALGVALASYLGYTLEVTDAMAEQRRISIALQESLLPPLLPSIPGLDIAARYRPSGPGNLVGGDFYDVFPTGAGTWNFLLGDASGIGPEAAGLAGIARYTARALGESSHSPLEILQHLNNAVLRAASDGRFCTAVVANVALDGSGAVVSLASAGHPPSFLQLSDGRVEPAMDDTGMLLGFLEDAPIAEQHLRLGPGDALILYTDGVLDARDTDSSVFGEERLGKVLADAAGRSAEGIARRLELEVLDHRSAESADDVAIVVVRVQPRGHFSHYDQRLEL